MEALSVYLLKLSISLSLVYLFYSVFLRPLTFYKWNRFFLVLYSFVAFLIPLINIGPDFEASKFSRQEWVQIIPVVEQISQPFISVPVSEVNTKTQGPNNPKIWLLLFFTGAIVMFVRLVLQYLSFMRVRRSAILLMHDGLKIYQVNKPIMPFSFGNSIFINNKRHNERELREIIRHEFVHVKQKHSFDILWAELLCVLNWYNPFAWLIRKSIKQNLEFIADAKVLESGLDRKQYQYLLLKVTGIASFGMGNNFNISSLKKRISMMNKSKSAGLNVIRFIFMLPLVGITLLAFRNLPSKNLLPGAYAVTYNYTGLIMDDAAKGIEGIGVQDKISGLETITDSKGYFILNIPVKAGQILELTPLIKIKGELPRQVGQMTIKDPAKDNFTTFNFIKITRNPNRPEHFEYNSSVTSGSNNGVQSDSKVDFDVVNKQFSIYQERQKLHQQIRDITKNTDDVIVRLDGIPYAVSAFGIAWFDKSEMKNPDDFKVMIDGKLINKEEANILYKRKDFSSVGATGRIGALKNYGVNENLFILESDKYQEKIQGSLQNSSGKSEQKIGMAQSGVNAGEKTQITRDAPDKRKVILEIVNTHTEQDLRQYQTSLSNKGLKFNFSNLKTANGEILSLSGRLSDGKKDCAFSANKFKKITIYAVINEDGSTGYNVQVSTLSSSI